MGERKGTRGLELWCKRMTEGYPGVKVENMTTSWRDGLAFCAIIHHFRPDLIDFSKLNKNDIYNNNNLAFRVAEDHLGIPALLEPEDMVEYAVPDRLSILTYLSQFYQVFAVNSNSPTKVQSKRPPPTDLQRHMVTSPSSSPPKKTALGVLGARKEPCAKCGLPVFIAERLNVRKTLYHRTCFRCAKCDSQLTLHNYTDAENDQFCCKVCPDEEKAAAASVLSRSLSDEEKSASLKTDSDPYSANFENVLEDPKDGSLKRSFTLERMLGSSFVKARSDFMATQVTSFGSDLDAEDKPPDLPVSQRPLLDQDGAKHSENIDDFSNYSLPSLSDNFSVNSDRQAPDQEQCNPRDHVTKDPIPVEKESVKPSIRSRVELFEACSKNSSKTDVHKESLEESDDCVGVPVLGSPEEPSKLEDISSASSDNDLSIHENVQEDSSPRNSPNRAHSSILSDSSIISETNEEVIVLSSKSSAHPEDSMIVISDASEDLKSKASTPNDENSQLNTLSDDDQEKPAPLTEYPDELNPFGDEETDQSLGDVEPPKDTSKSASLNPFGDTDDEEVEPSGGPFANSKSLNPFGSDEDEEDENCASSLPPQPALRKLKAPKISLSPYWNEEQHIDKSTNTQCDEGDDSRTKTSISPPQPALRKLKPPRISLTPYWDEASSSYSSPSKSQAEKSSLQGSGRKKKPAPKPPTYSLRQDPNESPLSSLNSSENQSTGQSFKEPPRSRKTKRAPLPPTSTPIKHFESSKLPTVSPIGENRSAKGKSSQHRMLGEEETKDEINRNKHSDPSCSVRRLTSKEIEHDLELIEVQLRGLEKNGVKLEKIIREKTEIPGANPDDTLAPEIEDMILQLFELINDKHELFRKQTELMYLRRQNRLEKEQADIENQLRCLMLQPDAHKTDSDKAKEEELLNKMLEIVERRNEIVDRLEVERKREAEEDNSIRSEMSLYSMKRRAESSLSKKNKKEKQKSEKDREKNTKKIKGVDKDIDGSVKITQKDKKKKKVLNLF